jgi:hypothetical protein
LAKVRAKETERSLSGYVEFLIEADIAKQNWNATNLNDSSAAATFAEGIIAVNKELFRDLAQ